MICVTGTSVLLGAPGEAKEKGIKAKSSVMDVGHKLTFSRAKRV